LQAPKCGIIKAAVNLIKVIAQKQALNLVISSARHKGGKNKENGVKSCFPYCKTCILLYGLLGLHGLTAGVKPVRTLKWNFMRVKKISLNQDDNIYELNGENTIDFYRPQAKSFVIELIEIKNVESPSALEIEIKAGLSRRVIRLFQHRMKFLFQNGVFILDTSQIPEFSLNLEHINDYHYYIKVFPSGEDFSLTMYGVTDQTEQPSKFLRV
jgi:hypothetical protein